MDNQFNHEGGDFLSAVSHLGMPLGLAVLANNLDSKDKSGDKKSDKQKGGVFLSDSLLLEAGLAVVPFGLIALTESEDDKNTNSKK